MHTSYRVNVATSYGQQVQIVLGDDAVDLQWLGDRWWGGSAPGASSADYRYRIVAARKVVTEEPAPYRSCHEPRPDGLTVVDRWRGEDAARLSRHSALFTKSLSVRHGAAGEAGSGSLRFRLHEPWIPEGATPAVVGSASELGAWDPARALPMTPSPFPLWEAAVDLEGDTIVYKYVLLDGDGSLLTWESGPDRELPPLSARPAIVHDDQIRGIDPWRGAGVAVPVFSLRTDNGLGAGQFTDLVPLADWAADVGISLIQLLPVNDTVLNHDWDDSYPYNPVSVQALHPLYLDIAAISGHGVGKALAKTRRQLNGLDEIDYVAVMEKKWELLRRAYTNLSEALDADATFAEFVKEHWPWLGPYSAWAVFRDRYGTPDSARWGPDARYDPDRMAAMARPESDDYGDMRFHWFVQFHLNRQLNAAADYVRSRGIALNGDLPIGVAPESVDVWTQPELFHLGAQTGAPPDAFAIRGQNWEFPTYDWARMADDGYAWWQNRFKALAEYVDVYRIDHVLGFFRIWEIPAGGYDGLFGNFRPSIPLSEAEVQAALGPLDLQPFTRPFVDRTRIKARFGKHGAAVTARFFAGPTGAPEFRPDIATQADIRRAFAAGALADLSDAERAVVERGLLDMAADVLLVTVDDGFAPRISWEDSAHYERLDPTQQRRFDAMAIDFFHHRHAAQWEEQGRRTLPAIVSATNLLTCGEDLGMVPDLVPRIMNELGLLSLEIERMPKRLGEWVADPARAPYLSVVSPGTHDTTTLRQWWAEDPERAERYWSEALGQLAKPPADAMPKLVAAILKRQLQSPAMLCVIPIADLFAIDGDLRRADADAERINDPSNRHNRWSYRMHLTLAELAAAEDFNAQVRSMISGAGR